MAGIFIYSDKLDIAAELVGFAKNAGKSAVILTVNAEDAEKSAGFGADQIYVLEGGSDAIENYGKTIAALLIDEQAELFAVGSTVRGREVASNVAGYLNCAMVSDVHSAEFQGDMLVTTRMIYGGAVVQTENITGLGVITVPAALFEAVQTEAETVITKKSVEVNNRVQKISTEPIVRGGVDLKQAERIVSVGLGLNKEEDMQMIYALAEVMNAEVGCSRSIAEEKKWLPEAQYVGITGTQVKPKVYIACGISGQAQHLFGIKDSKIIVGINKDENAPIFRACDYGIVGDMYEVIPALTNVLREL